MHLIIPGLIYQIKSLNESYLFNPQINKWKKSEPWMHLISQYQSVKSTHAQVLLHLTNKSRNVKEKKYKPEIGFCVFVKNFYMQYFQCKFPDWLTC